MSGNAIFQSNVLSRQKSQGQLLDNKFQEIYPWNQLKRKISEETLIKNVSETRFRALEKQAEPETPAKATDSKTSVEKDSKEVKMTKAI